MSTRTAAEVLSPLVKRLLGERAPLRVEFWDGSTLEGGGKARGLVAVRSPQALRRLLFAPGELGLARAFVSGELDLELIGASGTAPGLGDGTGGTFELLRDLRDASSDRHTKVLSSLTQLVSAVAELRLLGSPPPPPSVEVRLSGRFRPRSLHSRQRDEEAVRHHYDIGNEFYSLVLGPAMTYSCARFERPGATLEEAQASKHDLICRKLGLGQAAAPGSRTRRLLDVGCGWGSMALHAAERYGADAVGVTLSPAQAKLARERASAANLADRVEIRLQDYRELSGETFEAISSVGMFEHVGMRRMDEYFTTLFGLLSPRGRMVNHAISHVGGSRLRGRTFMNRYVFPDGELLDVGDVVSGMERAGFEVRDVESLREHYAKTLRLWVANLERNWSEAVELVGAERARVWRLYMSASVNAFEDNAIAVHQVLGVKPDSKGASGMPATRADWG